MKRTLPVFIIAFAALCIGTFIYAGTRTDALMLNQWTSQLSGHSLKPCLQDLFSGLTFPSWFIYSLPDGLWMMALMLVVMMIWNFSFTSRSISWYAGAFIAGILFEAGQNVQWIIGTFDVIDLLFISLGAVLPISFTLLKSRLCKSS